jgi:hypothetical protein
VERSGALVAFEQIVRDVKNAISITSGRETDDGASRSSPRPIDEA